MANPHKGEVEFKVGEKSYTLRLSADAICNVEEATGKGVLVLLEQLNKKETVTMGLVRLFLWAGLKEHHPEIDIKTAGELIVDAGGIFAVLEIFMLAFARAFPDGEAGESGNPPTPGQVMTGPDSAERGKALN